MTSREQNFKQFKEDLIKFQSFFKENNYQYLLNNNNLYELIYLDKKIAKIRDFYEDFSYNEKREIANTFISVYYFLDYKIGYLDNYYMQRKNSDIMSKNNNIDEIMKIFKNFEDVYNFLIEYEDYTKEYPYNYNNLYEKYDIKKI